MKFLKISLVMTIVAALVFQSCTKNEAETLTKVETSNTIDQLAELSLNYTDVENPAQCIDWDKVKKAIKTAGKDLGGAVAGAVAGLTVGKHFDDPPSKKNAKTGSVLGGVGGGAGASSKAAFQELGDKPLVKQEPDFGDYTVCLLNEFDIAAKKHYKTIDESLGDEANYLTDGEYDVDAFYGFATSFLIDDGFVVLDDLILYTSTMNQDDQNYVENNWGEGFLDFLDNAEEDLIISADIQDVFEIYYETFLECEGLEAFLTYSVEAEELIAASTSLTEEDRDIILLGMATFRYGMQYWTYYED